MHKTFWAVIAVFFSFVLSLSAQTQPRPKDLVVRFKSPAKSWKEAIPMGNGRLQALISGTVGQDTIRLGEDTYANVGSLLLAFPGNGEVSNYRRFLNLEKGISQVAYSVGDVDYRRETFCSFADQVVIVRLEASKKGKLQFQTAWVGAEKSKQTKSTSTTLDKQTLEVLTVGGENVPEKMQCYSYVRVLDTDGKVANKMTEVNTDAGAAPEKVACLEVKGASFATVVISCADNYVSTHVVGGDAKAKAMKYLTDYESKQKTFPQAELDHSKIYQQQFGRVSLYLGYNEKQAKKDILTRIQDYKTSDDPSLPAMFYQFGRYMMISNSQPTSHTPNVNDIRLEMNYWPAETCNLAECGEPFLKLIKEVGESGQSSAKSLCKYIWDHYLYTGNKQWLRENYSILRETATLHEDYLRRDPAYYGLTKDNVMVYDLLKTASTAAKILVTDLDHAVVWDSLRSQMPKLVVDSKGRLQEGLKDWDKDNSGPLSCLWSAFPGSQLSPYENDTLFQAIKKNLLAQYGEDDICQLGWQACLWARLLNGNMALEAMRNLIVKNDPSQLEGLYACTAGVAEMFVQSHAGYLHVLPALPDEWKMEGQVRGLKTRGGFEIVDLTWKFGRLETLVIRSKFGGNLRIRSITPLKLQDALGLKLASEPNPNLLTQPYDMPIPSVADPSKIPAIEEKDAFVYDLDTRQGKMYVFKSGM